MNTQLCFVIKFDSHTVKKVLSFPEQDTVIVNIEQPNQPINIEQITLNDIAVNPYYNTSFTFKNSKTTITSVHTIEKAGTYKIKVDRQYILSQRSSNYHCSSTKEDFIFQYESTRNSFVNDYRDRNHKGFTKPFIPCFGCSNTYGAYQPDTDTWPYLLSKKTNKNFLNLGVGGSGIDGIYNNLKLLYAKHQFDQAVILFPNFERRVVRCQIDDLWLRIFSTIHILSIDIPYHFYADKTLRLKWKRVREKIINDTHNRYSKKFLSKIVNFCQQNKIRLHCSSWDDSVYQTLKGIKNINLLPAFPSFDLFSERADDGKHPHKKHYEHFVDSILRIGNFTQKD